MGPPRPPGSGQRSTHGKVAPAPLNLLSSADGGLFALSQARQLTLGWHYPAAGGRHEEPWFERHVKSLLASAHSGGSFALSLYDGTGIEVIRKVLEEAFEGRLPVEGLHVCCGWLNPLTDPPADVKQSVPNAFWPTGATTTGNNPVYGGPPSEGPACLRWELLPEACKMRTLVRFLVPSDLCPDPAERWYIEMKAATAQAAYADALKVSNRSEVLDLMIGPLHNGTLYSVDVTESGWKHARGVVTDLTKPFLATGWPLGATDTSAVAGNEPSEEECATAQFKLDHTPDAFGHYTMRGKHWHKLSDFQITGLECTMVREAAGGDEEPTLTRVLNCLKQDGTTVTVPICLDKLAGRSISDKFTSVDPELSVTSKLTVGALTDLFASLPTPPSRTAPLRFGTQPDGSRLYSDCVLPADGSAPVPLTEAGLYLDESYFKKGLGLGIGDYPTLLHVPLAEGRHACFRLMTDNWETVFGSNFVPAWLSMAYGVAGFHYCHYQEVLGSWPLCYAYGGPDTGKTTSSDIVKSLTGVQSALLAGSSITEPKLAQALSARADLCLVVDDFKPKKEDERMETASRMLAARSERSNMQSSFRPHSALLVSVRDSPPPTPPAAGPNLDTPRTPCMPAPPHTQSTRRRQRHIDPTPTSREPTAPWWPPGPAGRGSACLPPAQTPSYASYPPPASCSADGCARSSDSSDTRAR